MTVMHRVDPELAAVVRMMPAIDLADIPAARDALQAVFALVNTAAPNPEWEQRWLRWLMLSLCGLLCCEWLIRRLAKLA